MATTQPEKSGPPDPGGSRFRRVLLVAGGVAVLALAGLVTTLSLVDWNDYRRDLATLASNRIGLSVDLGGDVSVSLLPRPSFTARQVVLRPLDGAKGDVVARADRIALRLGVGALLRGDLALKRVVLDGAALTLEQGDEGWRLAGLAAGSTGSRAVTLDRLRLRDGAITLRPRNGPERRLTAVDATLGGNLPAGPVTWEASARLGGWDLAADGRFRARPEGEGDSLDLSVSLAGASMDLNGRLFDDGMDGRLKLSGDDAVAFLSAVKALTGGGPSRGIETAIPFLVDAQLRRDTHMQHVTTRRMRLGETRGQATLMAAPGGQAHLAGSVALGVVHADLLRALMVGLAAPDTVDAAPMDDGGAHDMPEYSAALDLTLEGFEWRGGVVQHLESGLSITANRLRLEQMQGLLPGGARLALTATLTTGDGPDLRGQVHMGQGNIRKVLAWLGGERAQSLLQRVPMDRLATGRLNADVHWTPGRWTVDDLSGRLDAIRFKGAMAGTDKGLSSLNMEAGPVALAAYGLGLSPASGDMANGAAPEGAPWPDRLGRALELVAPEDGSALDFDLLLDSVALGVTRLDRLAARGTLTRERLLLDSLVLGPDGAGASLAGSVHLARDDRRLDLRATLAQAPDSLSDVLAAFAAPSIRPAVAEGPEALGLAPLTGSVRLTGPLDRARLALDLSGQGRRHLRADGMVPLLPDGPLDLQLDVSNPDLAPALRLAGWPVAARVPADMTMDIAGGAEEPLSLRMSGGLIGGRIRVTARRAPGPQGASPGWQLEGGFDHDSPATLADAFYSPVSFADMSLPDAAGSLSLSGWMQGPRHWDATRLDLAVGEARLTGKLSLMSNNILDGALTIRGLDIGTKLLKARENGAVSGASASGPRLPAALDGITGSVSLAVSDSHMLGQPLLAPSAGLTLAAEDVTVTAGPDARLGDGALALDARLNWADDDRKGGASVRLDAAALDMGAALADLGAGRVLSGAARVSLDLAASPVLVSALNGTVDLNGSNMRLGFLDAPGMSALIRTADSGSGFLDRMGGFLRDGETAARDVTVSLALQDGTARIQTAEAAGPWGRLGLTGSIALSDAQMTVDGTLALSQPPDTPAIPLAFRGAIDQPRLRVESRALERFALSEIRSRLGAALQDRMSGDTGNPGAAVMGAALSLLDQLGRKRATEAPEDAAQDESGGDADGGG
ncbi:AsmA family protein [Yunchengibacter salinarum]|uniref:AsmA family protein n=1 Tax=Yunchengibacter salinarum TaxID=3133399 RepID=UPI0035B5D88A